MFLNLLRTMVEGEDALGCSSHGTSSRVKYAQGMREPSSIPMKVTLQVHRVWSTPCLFGGRRYDKRGYSRLNFEVVSAVTHKTK